LDLLIIGASGATGHHFVRDTAAQGHRVTAFVRTPEAFSAPDSVRVAKGDVRHAVSLAAGMKAKGVRTW